MYLTLILLQSTVHAAQQSVSIFTIIAAIAASISAYSAFMSRGYAKSSFNLSNKVYNDKQSNFKLYLVESNRIRLKSIDDRALLLFNIRLSNLSDSKSSFGASLKIQYSKAGSNTYIVIVDHDESVLIEMLRNRYTTFPNDIRIDERGIQTKWLVFKQPKENFKDSRIEKYSVIVTDSFGNESTLDSYIISDKSYEN